MEKLNSKKSLRYPTGKLTLLQSMALLIVLSLAVTGLYALLVHSN
jgi:hypothetical protein